MLSRLRRHPGFVSAKARIAQSLGQRCDYKTVTTATGIATCDLWCRSFKSLDEAQRACDPRPSCRQVVAWANGVFELRGAPTPGSAVSRSYLKLSCSKDVGSLLRSK